MKIFFALVLLATWQACDAAKPTPKPWIPIDQTCVEGNCSPSKLFDGCQKKNGYWITDMDALLEVFQKAMANGIETDITTDVPIKIQRVREILEMVSKENDTNLDVIEGLSKTFIFPGGFEEFAQYVLGISQTISRPEVIGCEGDDTNCTVTFAPVLKYIFNSIASFFGQLGTFPVVHKPFLKSILFGLPNNLGTGNKLEVAVNAILEITETYEKENEGKAPTISQVMRLLARKIRGDNGIVSWITATVGGFLADIDADEKRTLTRNLDIGAYALDFYMELCTADGYQNLLKKLSAIADERGSPEVRKYAKYYHDVLTRMDNAADSKEIIVQLSRDLFSQVLAHFAAPTAPLPAGVEPHPLGCNFNQAVIDEMIGKLYSEETKLSDSFSQTDFDSMLTLMLESVADNGRGCAKAYLAANEGELFGGITFPEHVITAFADLLWGILPTTPNSNNVEFMYRLIEEVIKYSRRLIAIDPVSVMNNPDPWQGSIIDKHCKALGIDDVLDAQTDPALIQKMYRKLVRQVHPDKPNGSQKRFLEVKNAYEALHTAFADDKKSRSAYVDLLNAMKDTMHFITSQRNKNVGNVGTVGSSGGLTEMVKHVHDEYVTRQLDKLELDGEDDHTDILGLEEQLALPSEVSMVTKLLDTFLSNEKTENRCVLLYKTSLTIMKELSTKIGAPTYPAMLLQIMLINGVPVISQEQYDAVIATGKKLNEKELKLWELQTIFADKELKLVEAMCNAGNEVFDINADGSLDYKDLLGSLDADGDGDVDGSDMFHASSEAIKNNVGDFAALENYFQSFLEQKNIIPDFIEEHEHYLNSPFYGAYMEYYISLLNLIYEGENMASDSTGHLEQAVAAAAAAKDCANDEVCIQAKFGSGYTCASSSSYCTGYYSSDMLPCCPVTCNTCPSVKDAESKVDEIKKRIARENNMIESLNLYAKDIPHCGSLTRIVNHLDPQLIQEMFAD